VLPIEEAEKLKAALEKPSVVTQDWQPIETAPRDGSVIALIKYHKDAQDMYAAWWMEREQSEGADGTETEGHMWILNDGTDFIIEEDEDMSPWYWQPIQTPSTEEMNHE